MKTLKLFLCLLFLFALAASAQTAPIYKYADPSGPCTSENIPHVWSLASYTDWYCSSSTRLWTRVNPLVLDSSGNASLATAKSLTVGAATCDGTPDGSICLPGKVIANGIDLSQAGGAASGAYVAVAFSATPVFALANSTVQGFAITLTGNVSSSTFSGTPVFGNLWFKVCQDETGGRTFVFPTNVVRQDAIDTAAGVCTTQLFAWDGANYVGIAGGKSDSTTPGFLNGGFAYGLPGASDTLVGRASTDTLTNKTINGASNTLTIRVADLPAAAKIRTCDIVIGDPGAASAALANDNDSPGVCGNSTGADLTITGVACLANAGTPTVTPVFSDASAILSGALACGAGTWAAGSLSGTPVQHSFSGSGLATCSVQPCAIDANITTAGGTAKYIVIRITRTL